MPVRPRYFSGQLLTDQVLACEQSYHLEKRRAYNRAVHGCCVVAGLEVALETTCSDHIRVSAGFAIDRSGNEIPVEQPQLMSIQCLGDRCFVTLQYVETADAPQLICCSSDDDAKYHEYSRIVESFVIGVTEVSPSPTSEILLLATLIRRQGCWQIEVPPRRLQLTR
jgi:hypothetical protein